MAVTSLNDVFIITQNFSKLGTEWYRKNIWLWFGAQAPLVIINSKSERLWNTPAVACLQRNFSRIKRFKIDRFNGKFSSDNPKLYSYFTSSWIRWNSFLRFEFLFVPFMIFESLYFTNQNKTPNVIIIQPMVKRYAIFTKYIRFF